MRVQIGRFGTNPIIDNAGTASRNETTWQLGGHIEAQSLFDLGVLRDQIAALASNTDEPIVPVIADNVRSGFWAVTSVSWNETAGSYDTLLQADWSVTLQAVPSKESAMMESRALFATGAVGSLTRAPWIAAPGSAQAFTASPYAAYTTESITADSGAVTVYASSGFGDGGALWRQSPDTAYEGATLLEAGDSGASGSATSVPGAQSWWSPGTYSYVVPTGVTSLRAELRGGNGGGALTRNTGGQGVALIDTLTVTPGETLTIVVGGNGSMGLTCPTGTSHAGGGAGGYNGGGNGGDCTAPGNGLMSGGGGGGGASDIRQGGTGLANRVLIAAGGGGGGGGAMYYGGDAALPNGGNGGPNNYGGFGATSSFSGGRGYGQNTGPQGTDGDSVSVGIGGVGGQNNVISGGWGGGGGGGGGLHGGGGGYAGGGGGGTGRAASGGAGSSLTPTGSIASGASTTPHVTVVPFVATDVGQPVDGIDYRPVIGRDVPPDPFGWRVSNGILRIRPTFSTSEIGIAIERWIGSGWSDVRTFGVFKLVAGSRVSPSAIATTVTCLRNSVEETGLRCVYGTSGDQFTVDYTLRRGARTVIVYARAMSGAALTFGLAPTEAMTNVSTTPLVQASTTAASDGTKAFTGTDGTVFFEGVVYGSESASTIAAQMIAVGSETVRVIVP